MSNKRVIPYIAVGVVGIAAVVGIVVANQEPCNAQSCKTQTAAVSQKSKSDIEKIKGELNNGALLVDVRTPEEYAGGHAEGAINLPYDQIVGGTYPARNKDAKIYVYCRSGKRAATALDALRQAGYVNAASLISLENWQKLGGTVTE